MTNTMTAFAARESFLVLTPRKPPRRFSTMFSRQWNRVRSSTRHDSKLRHQPTDSSSGDEGDKLSNPHDSGRWQPSAIVDETEMVEELALSPRQRYGTAPRPGASVPEEMFSRPMSAAAAQPLGTKQTLRTLSVALPAPNGMQSSPTRMAPRPADHLSLVLHNSIVLDVPAATGLAAPVPPSAMPPASATTQDRAGRLTGHLRKLHDHEVEYVKTLETLHDEFELPLRAQLLPQKLRSKQATVANRAHHRRNGSKQKPAAVVLDMLFSHLDSITSMHRKLRDEVASMQPMYSYRADNTDAYATNCIAIFLGKRLTELGVYIEFVKHQTYALCAFENLYYIDEKFRNAVVKCERESGHQLRQLLVQPRECVWYYVGFVQEIMNICTNQPEGTISSSEPSSSSNPGHAGVRACLQYLKSLYRGIGPWLRQTERVAELAELQSQIRNLAEPLVEFDLTMLHDGELHYHSSFKAASQAARCWLFNNRLVCARLLPDGALEHTVTIPLLRNTVISACTDQDGQYLHTIHVRFDKREAHLRVNTDHDFDVWWNAIQYALRTHPSRRTSRVTVWRQNYKDA
ncbi:hypothetical protein THASP1DRAFT_24714 [Thamnocephalis sphaerospora]|uniref:DH domain-containing protein n=1 Tax=Thamnocephalis sphaerospora TaxID=78915 RepID=A0A4P9XMI2_9FUNG|nr:hypothetical protein THASP1DRAFT_24714 [Thamnocephalis sphaerospora]|eukprot:RKP07076.1 hypothetical protein THASP1DRAFT_24714 [Thamnocephalis sphaerospora]